MKDRNWIGEACKAVGCKKKDLLSSRVVEGEGGEVTEIVLIVGPVGYKKIVPVGDLAAPPPVTTHVEAPVQAVAFEDLVGERVYAILVKKNLADRAALEAMTNADLEAIEGLGRASVQAIRAALEQLG